MSEDFIQSIKKNYRPRIIDTRFNELLDTFGGVLITGPKWCGKSWSAAKVAESAIFIDDADNAARARLLPELVLNGVTPRLIDEWQDVPALWDAARRLIDTRRKPGQFIFTGSTTPPKERTSHTGTGRFARLRMRTLTLFEEGLSSGSVSLKELFDCSGKIQSQLSKYDFSKALKDICNGGWPSNLWTTNKRPGVIAGEYLKSVVENDLSRADGIRRDPQMVSLLLRSLARNSATTVKATTLRQDIIAVEGDDLISDQTIRSYLQALKDLFIIEEQPSWAPSLRSRKRIRVSPKLHFSDPSLAAAALGATPELLQQDIQTAGFLFESICYRDLSVYASAINGRVHHYQDNAGLEVDMVITLEDGRWGAIEVKLGVFEFDKAAANLQHLSRKLSGEAPAPSFLAIVTASGGVAQTRSDGVNVIPLDCLAP
ncbi:MAG: ATP-binding protein [Lentisphaerae bacterium]|jgi:predicted AAA+ superfamily ATPase|nr:ATP-binding protein [Lentisphaerota bacterium]